MNISRFSSYIVIGLYGFFQALVISIGSVLTQEWYDESLRELRIRLAITFDISGYVRDLNSLDAQRKLILGVTELVFLIVGSRLIIQYSRSKYFERAQIDKGGHISGKNVKSLISIGMLGGFTFYSIVFIIGLLTGGPFLETPLNECNSILFDLNLCSEFLPTYIHFETNNFASIILISLSFLLISLLASIYPTILLIYLSVMRTDRQSID